jgi:hypothetical protein
MINLWPAFIDWLATESVMPRWISRIGILFIVMFFMKLFLANK